MLLCSITNDFGKLEKTRLLGDFQRDAQETGHVRRPSRSPGAAHGTIFHHGREGLAILNK